MKRFALFFLIFPVLISCQKDKVDLSNQGNAAQIIGDYEWYESTKGVNNSIYQDQTNDRYGMRIDEKSRVFIFKNGERIFKGYCSSVSYINNTNLWSLYVKNKNESQQLFYENGVISCDKWPNWGYTNKWLKK